MIAVTVEVAGFSGKGGRSRVSVLLCSWLRCGIEGQRPLVKLELGWAGPVVVQSSVAAGQEAQGSSDALACRGLPAGNTASVMAHT